jgi:hypothetical protein
MLYLLVKVVVYFIGVKRANVKRVSVAEFDLQKDFPPFLLNIMELITALLKCYNITKFLSVLHTSTVIEAHIIDAFS